MISKKKINYFTVVILLVFTKLINLINSDISMMEGFSFLGDSVNAVIMSLEDPSLITDYSYSCTEKTFIHLSEDIVEVFEIVSPFTTTIPILEPILLTRSGIISFNELAQLLPGLKDPIYLDHTNCGDIEHHPVAKEFIRMIDIDPNVNLIRAFAIFAAKFYTHNLILDRMDGDVNACIPYYEATLVKTLQQLSESYHVDLT